MKYDLSFLETDLKELLKKLKKHNTYAVQLENEIILYAQENARLKESEEYHRKGYADLHQRIEEAIEILGNWTIFETSAYTDKIISETLDILKGADKEWNKKK